LLLSLSFGFLRRSLDLKTPVLGRLPRGLLDASDGHVRLPLGLGLLPCHRVVSFRQLLESVSGRKGDAISFGRSTRTHSGRFLPRVGSSKLTHPAFVFSTTS